MALDFADFIVEPATIDDLAALDRRGALVEMLDAFVRARVLTDAQAPGVLEALLQREGISTTAIGNGIAIPHTKHPAIGRLTGLVARSREGIDYGAENGETTHIFFMILSGSQDHMRHLDALSRVSRSAKDPLFAKFLLGARDADAMTDYLNQCDGNRV